MLGFGLKSVGCFVAGVLFGTAGVKVLSSKDAKNMYVKSTAAALRAKDCVMETVTNIQADKKLLEVLEEEVLKNTKKISENKDY